MVRMDPERCAFVDMILDVIDDAPIMVAIADPNRVASLAPDRTRQLFSHAMRGELLRLADDRLCVSGANTNEGVNMSCAHSDDARWDVQHHPLCRQRVHDHGANVRREVQGTPNDCASIFA